MIRTLILSTVAGAALIGTALAADDVMASRYGNTTKATNAQGEVTKLWYEADGTFTGEAQGNMIKGTWKIDGDKVCLTQTDPAPEPDAPTNQCNPVTAHNVGDSWEIGEGEQQIKIELLAGKQ